MSELIVEICTVDDIIAHPDPETVSLEIAKIKGWEAVVRKEQYAVGDKVVYLPPDCLVPTALTDEIGATKYLAELPKGHEYRDTHRRVKASRIRGYPSYGLILDKKIQVDESQNIAEQLGIIKWEPPVKETCGDAAKQNSLFHRYTNMENIRNCPNILKTDEEVVVHEKIHGENCRVGIINGEWAAGSHSIQRSPFDKNGNESKYWKPLNNSKLRNMINDICTNFQGGFNLVDKQHHNLIVFGELYGTQGGMRYGKTESDFAAFDISVNGQYLDYDVFKTICDTYGIPTVPELYRGNYSFDKVKELTDGPIVIVDPTNLKDFSKREGVVIKPVIERQFDNYCNINKRCILKSVSADYLNKSNIEDSH